MNASPTKKTLSVLDYLLILGKWRRWLAINFLVICALTAVIVFSMPKWYKAAATILPPKKDAGMFGLSSMLSNIFRRI
jgi:uncharacterized protein involved in exopolysaccharide biosynthesis